MKLLAAFAVAVAGLGTSLFVATQPQRREAATVNSITQFGVDHPQWRMVVEQRIDITPLRFEHAVHMNPHTPQMQGRLKTWADAGGRHIVADGTGTLTMSCAACHETDQSDGGGRYMTPITFEQHCAACHSLGQRGGEAIPHGASAAAFAQRVAATAVLTPKPAKPAAPARGPRGPAGPRSPQATAASTAGTSAAPSLTEEQAQQQFAKAFADETVKTLRSIGQNCTKCHGKAGLDPASIAPPNIPDRWLTRSVFGHQAHTFMACADCHAAAAAVNPLSLDSDTSGGTAGGSPRDTSGDTSGGTSGGPSGGTSGGPSGGPSGGWTGRTRDVMLPDMHSCTTCHSPHPTQTKTPARFDCVLCHVYHPRP